MSQDVTIGKLDDFPDGELINLDVAGKPMIAGRIGSEVYVAVNHCPHLGFSLTKGPAGLRYADGVVQCPWHNSRFNICTGENLDWVTGFAGRDIPGWSRRLVALGRKPHNLNTLPTRVEDGTVIVTTSS